MFICAFILFFFVISVLLGINSKPRHKLRLKLTDAHRLSKKTGKGPTTGYSVQIAVDSKHKLLPLCEVMVDSPEIKSLVPVLENAMEILDTEIITATYYASLLLIFIQYCLNFF